MTSITPFENDTALAALMGEASKERYYLRSALSSLAAKNRDGSLRYEPGSYNYNTMVASRDKHQARLAELEVEMAPYHAEHAARRWARYFLVTNGNGHVHSSMSCSTCYATTEFAWLPELADKTQDEMVEEFGEKACTVCFPTAPVNPRFNAPGRRDREAVAAKQAEKDAKLAAKLAKAILPDGSALKLNDPYDRPKTLIAAQRCLSATLSNIRFYGDQDGRNEDVETLVGAIAAKTGRDYYEVLDEANAKADKKFKKDKAESEAHAKRMGWA